MADSETNVNAEREKASSRTKKRKSPREFWKSLSYTARLTIAFSFISIMTILVAFSVLSLVWSQHFSDYTRDNIERTAHSTAAAIADNYEDVYQWSPSVLAPAAAAAEVSDSIGIQVLDSSGGSRYNNTPDHSGKLGTPQKQSQMVSSPIMVDGEQVGTVNVWVYGSDTLLTSADREYRDSSLQAMFVAMILAIFISIVIGLAFSRGFVNPINRVMRTARAIKEGDLSARTRLSGEDEVSRLGMTFDAMADAIEKDRMMERRLTTDVAHELRTPLMAIQATIEAIVDGVFEPDEERLGTIDAEVQRLSRLVDALLKLSRLENRKIPMNKKRLNLGELITDIIGTHEAYVQDAGLKLVFEADDDVEVFGDADMLRQATANLISNAVRYTPEGTITVRVTRGETMASISVADTGIGLSPEECKKVFGRFWRGDAGRNRAQGGLGIGLSVVKEIVDRHNGLVRVEGEKGVGSTFTILIPLYDEGRAKAREAKDKDREAKSRDSKQRDGKARDSKREAKPEGKLGESAANDLLGEAATSGASDDELIGAPSKPHDDELIGAPRESKARDGKPSDSWNLDGEASEDGTSNRKESD